MAAFLTFRVTPNQRATSQDLAKLGLSQRSGLLVGVAGEPADSSEIAIRLDGYGLFLPGTVKGDWVLHASHRCSDYELASSAVITKSCLVVCAQGDPKRLSPSELGFPAATPYRASVGTVTAPPPARNKTVDVVVDVAVYGVTATVVGGVAEKLFGGRGMSQRALERQAEKNRRNSYKLGWRVQRARLTFLELGRLQLVSVTPANDNQHLLTLQGTTNTGQAQLLSLLLSGSVGEVTAFADHLLRAAGQARMARAAEVAPDDVSREQLQRILDPTRGPMLVMDGEYVHFTKVAVDDWV